MVCVVEMDARGHQREDAFEGRVLDARQLAAAQAMGRRWDEIRRCAAAIGWGLESHRTWAGLAGG